METVAVRFAHAATGAVSLSPLLHAVASKIFETTMAIGSVRGGPCPAANASGSTMNAVRNVVREPVSAIHLLGSRMWVPTWRLSVGRATGGVLEDHRLAAVLL